MEGPPYRTPLAPRAKRREHPRIDEATRLGALRSTHVPPSQRSLYASLVLGAVIGICLLLARGHGLPTTLVIVTAVTAVIGGWLRWIERARRHIRVDLHTNGVVVHGARGARDVVVFDDVDTLWLELDVHSSSFGKLARLIAIRLVDHDGGSHEVPVALHGGMAAAQWILRQCSDVLLDDARAALRDGEAMKFGDVTIDREGVTFEKVARVPWTEVRLVRLQPGSVSLFRAMPIVPWKTVRLDRIPHPTVFATLVRELAAHVEVDDPVHAKTRTQD